MINIQIKGIPEINRFLKNKSNQFLDKSNKAIHNAGFLIEGEVVQSIAGRRAERRSVDTGRFMGSINTDNSKEMESIVTSGVDYADVLEYGTSKRAPRSHFRNTARRNEHKVKDMIESAIH